MWSVTVENSQKWSVFSVALGTTCLKDLDDDYDVRRKYIMIIDNETYDDARRRIQRTEIYARIRSSRPKLKRNSKCYYVVMTVVAFSRPNLCAPRDTV